MRIGSKSQNKFFLSLNTKNEIIQKKFLEKISDATKAISQAVYPGDTASKLNPWPPEPPWYADARAEYANKFETA